MSSTVHYIYIPFTEQIIFQYSSKFIQLQPYKLYQKLCSLNLQIKIPSAALQKFFNSKVTLCNLVFISTCTLYLILSGLKKNLLSKKKFILILYCAWVLFEQNLINVWIKGKLFGSILHEPGSMSVLGIEIVTSPLWTFD